MQRTAQAWFMGGPSSNEQQKPTSLLADWKAYAASRSEDSASTADLEAAVPESFAPLLKTANDTVMGTFNVVSKGVRDLPGNFQSAASTMPSGKSIMYFGLLLATGIFFVFISFTMFLPVMVVMPQKFAICFTLGCIFIIGSFFALKGPRNQFVHMASKEIILFLPSSLNAYTQWLAGVRDSHSRQDSLGAWQPPFMCQWCYIVIYYLLFSLAYRFWHCRTMLFHTFQEGLLA